MVDFGHLDKFVIGSRWVSRMRRNVRRCRDEDMGMVLNGGVRIAAVRALSCCCCSNSRSVQIK